MSNTQTIAKFAAVAAGFGLVASSFVAALPAAAQTTTTTSSTMSASQVAALEAQIAALQAQLSATQGTSASVTFTRDLTVGSTGSDVTALQTWLIAKGYSVPAGATGYFGSQTKAALAAYQAANSISPAAGYFGPITRAQVNASAGSTTTTTTTTTTGGTTTTGTGTLSGSEGSINNFQTVGASTVTLGTGAMQQVYGFQFTANGSDLEVNRIYFDVANATTNGTTRPWNIFSMATLKDGSGNTVATLDLTNQANWSEDGTLSGTGNQVYRLDFENVNQVVKMNTTQSYYLTLTTQGAFAANNVVAGTAFEVNLASQGLRATDAMGLQQYSPSTANSANLGNGYTTVNVNTNSSGSVTLSTGSNNPQTQTIAANQNSVTNGVVLNTFTLQNTGTSNVELYTLPISVSTSTATLVNTVQDFKLYNGSTLLDTESPQQGGGSVATINFKNLNFVIPAGQTVSFSIQADIQPIGYSNPAANGATVTVTAPAGTPDIESASGAIIGISGTSTGYPISFSVNGLTIASNPTSATATVANQNNSTSTQTGTFTFVFNVTAFGQTIYVPASNSAFTATLYNQSANSSSTLTNGAITSGATLTNGAYMVSSGQTQTFTITAQANGNSQFYYAQLNTLNYGTTTGTYNQSVAFPSSYTTNAVSIHS